MILAWDYQYLPSGKTSNLLNNAILFLGGASKDGQSGTSDVFHRICVYRVRVG